MARCSECHGDGQGGGGGGGETVELCMLCVCCVGRLRNLLDIMPFIPLMSTSTSWVGKGQRRVNYFFRKNPAFIYAHVCIQ